MKTITTVNYYTTDADQNGDIVWDNSWAAGSKPAVVVIHGGSWANADKSVTQKVVDKFYTAGFAVFNINYRLVSDNGSNVGTRWPAQRIDAALAINWLKANGHQFGIDPDRIALYGFSAGGHIASVAAGYYNSVRAVVSVCAPLQPHRIADVALNKAWGNNVTNPSLVKLFGYITAALGYSYEPTWTNAGAAWNSFKPETYFGANKPAQYALFGRDDLVVPSDTQGAIEYWLGVAGQDHYTSLVEGRGHDEHMITGTGASDIARWNHMIAWLKTRTS